MCEVREKLNDEEYVDTESEAHEPQPELHESSDEDPIFENYDDEDDNVDVKFGDGGVKERLH